jgi:hypothetical protein
MESLVIDSPFNALPVLKSARRAAARPAQSVFSRRSAVFQRIVRDMIYRVCGGKIKKLTLFRCYFLNFDLSSDRHKILLYALKSFPVKDFSAYNRF